jgi:transketolase
MVQLNDLVKIYRRELFEKFLEVGQGHPGSTFSMLDIVTTLYHGGYVRLGTDKVLISKGHATVALYPILTKLGVIAPEDWENWGKRDCRLRVFGNREIPGIDMTSGSLGHGLGVGAGIALAARRDGIDKKVYVVISEGELYEGSTWEAMLFASHYKLNNLTVFIDINSLIILGDTSDCLNLNPIKDKIEGFNFLIQEINGHNTAEIQQALNINTDVSKVILAKTVKGKGISLMENKANWHYWNPLTPEEIQECRKEIA